MKNNIIILATILTLIPQTSFAYVGPGLAMGTLLMILGVLGSLVLAILAIVYYPIKKLIKKSKSKKNK